MERLYMMKVTIDELINDFYKLAEEEGYLSCLCEYDVITEDDEKDYYYSILNITEKYIPEYETFMGSQYFKKETTFEEKGQMLSDLALQNFKEIFTGLVIKNGEPKCY